MNHVRIQMNAIILLIIPILVLAPTLAYATNESSYKIGFNAGINDYKCTTNSDCDEPASNNDIQDCQLGHSVTNTTACTDGYVSGFKAWCKTDGLNCGFWASQGVFPRSLIALKNCIGWSAWHDHNDNL